VVGGLGVKEQQNGFCQVPTLLHVVSLCGNGPNKEFFRSKPKTADEREQI
jgi:hypothetical protein